MCNTYLNHGMLNASHTTQSHGKWGLRGRVHGVGTDGTRSPTHYFIGAEDPELHFLNLLQRSRRVVAEVRHVVYGGRRRSLVCRRVRWEGKEESDARCSQKGVAAWRHCHARIPRLFEHNDQCYTECSNNLSYVLRARVASHLYRCTSRKSSLSRMRAVESGAFFYTLPW